MALPPLRRRRRRRSQDCSPRARTPPRWRNAPRLWWPRPRWWVREARRSEVERFGGTTRRPGTDRRAAEHSTAGDGGIAARHSRARHGRGARAERAGRPGGELRSGRGPRRRFDGSAEALDTDGRTAGGAGPRVRRARDLRRRRRRAPELHRRLPEGARAAAVRLELPLPELPPVTPPQQLPRRQLPHVELPRPCRCRRRRRSRTRLPERPSLDVPLQRRVTCPPWPRSAAGRAARTTLPRVAHGHEPLLDGGVLLRPAPGPRGRRDRASPRRSRRPGLRSYAGENDMTLESCFETLLTGLAVRYYNAVAPEETNLSEDGLPFGHVGITSRGLRNDVQPLSSRGPVLRRRRRVRRSLPRLRG